MRMLTQGHAVDFLVGELKPSRRIYVMVCVIVTLTGFLDHHGIPSVRVSMRRCPEWFY